MMMILMIFRAPGDGTALLEILIREPLQLCREAESGGLRAHEVAMNFDILFHTYFR